MDHDVAQTLAALERKLAELERELTTLGRADVGAASGRPGDLDWGAGAGERRRGPVAPGPGTPGHPMPGPGTPGHPMSGPGVLVDEALEQRFSMEVRETPYGEIPAAREQRQAIDLADLVRFRERMQSTLQGLIDEYSRLLSLQPPSER